MCDNVTTKVAQGTKLSTSVRRRYIGNVSRYIAPCISITSARFQYIVYYIGAAYYKICCSALRDISSGFIRLITVVVLMKKKWL